MIVIYGTASSGKSDIAEDFALDLARNVAHNLYILLRWKVILKRLSKGLESIDLKEKVKAFTL